MKITSSSCKLLERYRTRPKIETNPVLCKRGVIKICVSHGRIEYDVADSMTMMARVSPHHPSR
jgi:hypothetical protein